MITLTVPDMSCGHCKASVEAALAPHASKIEVDLPARKVHVDGPDLDRMLEALADIGFPASKDA